MSEPKGMDDDPRIKELLAAIEAARERGQHDEMERLTLEFMALAAEYIEANPSPELELKMDAHQMEMEGDWAGAEPAYLKVLEIKELSQSAAGLYQAHANIAGFYAVQGKNDLAWDHQQSSTVWARQCKMEPIHLLALECEAGMARRRGEVALAWGLIEEAVGILDSEEGRSYDLARARILVVRSRLYLDAGALDEGEADLTIAQDILEPQSGFLIAAGIHSGLAGWWRATALLRAYRGDLTGSLSAWRESVGRCRHVATLSQLVGPFKYIYLGASLLRLAAALEKAGLGDEASAARREGQGIYLHFKLPVPAMESLD